jgi:hypothetical protein
MRVVEIRDSVAMGGVRLSKLLKLNVEQSITLTFDAYYGFAIVISNTLYPQGSP